MSNSSTTTRPTHPRVTRWATSLPRAATRRRQTMPWSRYYRCPTSPRRVPPRRRAICRCDFKCPATFILLLPPCLGYILTPTAHCCRYFPRQFSTVQVKLEYDTKADPPASDEVGDLIATSSDAPATNDAMIKILSVPNDLTPGATPTASDLQVRCAGRLRVHRCEPRHERLQMSCYLYSVAALPALGTN